MKSKRADLVLFLSLILFSVSPISAETCSGDNLLFSLNTITNAHAETEAQTSYVRDICYQTLMGQTPPSSPSRTCTGSNQILALSGVTNAHAEDPDLSNYATDICYQGLVCDVVSDPTASSTCTLGDGSAGNVIVRLSSLTNAHIEEKSAGGNYPYEVCCKLSTSLVWKDSNNNPLGPGAAYVGETIKAVATGTTDTSKLFTIEERDGSGEDTIISGATGSVSGADLVYSFTPTGDANDGPTAGTIDSILDHSSDPPSPGMFEIFFSISGLSLESYPITIGYCGDKLVHSGKEECDNGYDDASPNNGEVCTQTFQSGCTYCDASCNTVNLPILAYGDGIISSPTENCDCGSVALGTVHTNSAHPEGECSAGLGNQNTCTDDGDGSCAYCDAATGQKVVLNFEDVFWANLLGGKITSAEIGDTVMLKYPNAYTDTGFSGGDFRIYEDDGLLLGEDEIRTITGARVDDDGDGTGTNDDYTTTWTITEEDFNLGEGGNPLDPPYDFKFDIYVKSISDDDSLDISNPGENPDAGDGDDDLELTLIGPVCGSDIKASTTSKDIEFSLTDLDDLVSYTITINGVETITSEQNEGSIWVPGKASFKVPYTFSQVGVTNIRIDGESKRGDLLTVFSNVIVRADVPNEEVTFIASCISAPTHYADIDGDYADFIADVTAKRESSSIDFNSPDAEISSSDLLLRWTYSDGISFEATGDEPIATEHTKYFLTKGKNNWATLEAELI